MTEQEKFESWIEKVKTQNPEILDLENDERHSQNIIGWCWAAWQAALASKTIETEMTNKPQSIPPGMERPSGLPTSPPPPRVRGPVADWTGDGCSPIDDVREAAGKAIQDVGLPPPSTRGVSNRKIYKYPLVMVDLQVIEMPARAAILSAANQNGVLCLWAMVDPGATRTNRRIEIIGTGNPIPAIPGGYRTFIGTVVMDSFVWHVFERI